MGGVDVLPGVASGIWGPALVAVTLSRVLESSASHWQMKELDHVVGVYRLSVEIVCVTFSYSTGQNSVTCTPPNNIGG